MTRRVLVGTTVACALAMAAWLVSCVANHTWSAGSLFGMVAVVGLPLVLAPLALAIRVTLDDLPAVDWAANWGVVAFLMTCAAILIVAVLVSLVGPVGATSVLAPALGPDAETWCDCIVGRPQHDGFLLLAYLGGTYAVVWLAGAEPLGLSDWPCDGDELP